MARLPIVLVAALLVAFVPAPPTPRAVGALSAKIGSEKDRMLFPIAEGCLQ